MLSEAYLTMLHGHSQIWHAATRAKPYLTILHGHSQIWHAATRAKQAGFPAATWVTIIDIILLKSN